MAIAESDGAKSYATNGPAGGVITANYQDADGTILNGNTGNDSLKGGRYDDILNGGGGDDSYWGGAGADLFRFTATLIDGDSDYDRVNDVNFDEGDKLVFIDFAGQFAGVEGSAGTNVYNSDSSVQVSSWEGLANVVALGIGVTASAKGAGSDALILTLTYGAQTEVIEIKNGLIGYSAAGGILI